MKRIGIMGAPADNPNHGCMALLYSLLFNLNEIEQESGLSFQYVIFDWKYSEKHMDMLAAELGIVREKLIFAPYAMINDPIRCLYHVKSIVKMIQAIRRCDFIIDATEGDSFSDIYGDAWFTGRSRVKRLVQHLGVPLFLAPQTYGPYIKKKNRRLAAKVIKEAQGVMTRDLQSQKLIWEIAGKKGEYATDMAFRLPYTDYALEQTNKVKVGINASDLLYNTQEMRDRKFTLRADYRDYLKICLQELLSDGQYEVYLISHVNSDYNVHKEMKKQFSGLHLLPIFQNPIEAKSCIAQMDVFLGARMHGTIAAFTTKTACIPTSYSSKFAGVFSSLGYEVEVNLCELTAMEAAQRTLTYIGQWKQLQAQAEVCLSENKEAVIRVKKVLKDFLHKDAVNSDAV